MRKLLALAVVFGVVSPLAAQEKKAPNVEAIFKRMDKDGNGSLSLEEFRGKREGDKVEAAFKRIDKDGNGAISLEEFKAARAGAKPKADK